MTTTLPLKTTTNEIHLNSMTNINTMIEPPPPPPPTVSMESIDSSKLTSTTPISSPPPLSLTHPIHSSALSSSTSTPPESPLLSSTTTPNEVPISKTLSVPRPSTPPPLSPTPLSDSPIPLHSPSSSSSSSSPTTARSPTSTPPAPFLFEGEQEAVKEGEILTGETSFYNDSNKVPLFPSPSSSFRPTPNLDLESSETVKEKLDKRIVLEKEKRLPPSSIVTQMKDEEEEAIYDVTPTPLSPLFPAHPVLHPDPNAPSPESSFILEEQASPSTSHFSPTTTTTTTTTSMSTTTTGSSNHTHSHVYIRDFAFPIEDPRFEGGKHPDQLEGSSKREELENEGISPKVGNEDFSTSGSSGFSWGFVTLHQTDFQSEDESQPPSDDGSYSYSTNYKPFTEGDEDDQDQQQQQGAGQQGGGEEEEEEFIPGTYQALYDFVPELGTEMKLDAGEIINVYSRQCVGWVQAEKLNPQTGLSEEMGLVPENYLNLLEPDLNALIALQNQSNNNNHGNENGDEEDEDEEWEEGEEEQEQEQGEEEDADNEEEEERPVVTVKKEEDKEVVPTSVVVEEKEKVIEVEKVLTPTPDEIVVQG